MAEDGLGNLVNQIKRYVELGRRMLRRWPLLAIFFVLGAGGSLVVAFNVTRIYQSRTLISWKQQVSESTLGWEGGRHPENWLFHKLNQLVSSHTLLWKIANELDLYPKMRGFVATEVILETVQEAIKFGIVGNDSFWLAFEYKDPTVAQSVTQRLAREFIEQSMSDKQRAMFATQAFMDAEVKNVQKQLDGIEGELAQFVSEHPEFQVDPVTGMSRGGGQRGRRTRLPAGYEQAASPELRQALARKGTLEGQLQLALNPRSNARLVQAQEELRNARTTLASLKNKYTDRHPDVQRANTYVQQLEQQVAAASQGYGGGSAAVQVLRAEIVAVDATIARLTRMPQEQRQGATDGGSGAGAGRAADLSGPAQLEKRWYELTRDRAIARAKYEQISSQLLRTKLASTLESKQAETEFTVVDPASLPQKPVRPSRVKIVLAGTALGIVLGLGVAGLLVIFDSRIYCDDDLRKVCDLQILAQIPRGT